MKVNPVQLLLIVLILYVPVNLTYQWKKDRIPKIFGDDIPDYSLITSSKRVQQKLIVYHNYFRRKVRPPAANMLTLKWHQGAARTAQIWAESCEFLVHQIPKLRTHEPFGACGQNIFVSTQKVPWLFALRSWFIERQNFTFGGQSNILKDVGHYTQMVWAATHYVGCGISKCNSLGPAGQTFYNYVCDYCPIGNYNNRLGFPYKVGQNCSSCPNSCVNKLCVNSCRAVDLWSNCDSLKITNYDWLCNTETYDGYKRRKNCNATCSCEGKIYD